MSSTLLGTALNAEGVLRAAMSPSEQNPTKVTASPKPRIALRLKDLALPVEVAPLVRQMTDCARTHDFRAINRAYRALLIHPAFERHPLGLASIMERLAIYYRTMGLDGEALYILGEATSRFEVWPFGYYQRGMAQLSLGDVESATKSFARCKQMAPNYRDVSRWAELLTEAKQGEVPRALALEVLYLQEHPEQVGKAPSHLLEIAKEHPHLQLAKLLVARYLIETGSTQSEYDEAKTLLEEVALNSESDLLSAVEARFLLAGMQHELNSELTIELLREVIDLFPQSIWGQLADAVLNHELHPGEMAWNFRPDGSVDLGMLEGGIPQSNNANGSGQAASAGQ